MMKPLQAFSSADGLVKLVSQGRWRRCWGSTWLYLFLFLFFFWWIDNSFETCKWDSSGVQNLYWENKGENCYQSEERNFATAFPLSKAAEHALYGCANLSWDIGACYNVVVVLLLPKEEQQWHWVICKPRHILHVLVINYNRFAKWNSVSEELWSYCSQNQ